MIRLELVLYLAAFLFGGAGAWIIARYGHKLGLLDSPSERSSHDTATPKGGGIGIVVAFAVLSAILAVPWSFWIPATMLALLSFWGDRSELSLVIRLLFQFAASTILVLGIFLGNQMEILDVLMIVLLAVFIVGTSNVYNFMDGINGIAAVTGMVGFGLLALFGFGLLALYGLRAGIDRPYLVLTGCISIACLGFLPFNMPKSKVFMGDTGSVMLGFVFAGTVIWFSRSLLDFIVLAAFLFPFYADELTTMIVRIRASENLLRPHRRHLYQLMANEMKMPHWKISVGYGLGQLAVGITVLLIRPFGVFVVSVVLVVYLSVFAAISCSVRRAVLDKNCKVNRESV